MNRKADIIKCGEEHRQLEEGLIQLKLITELVQEYADKETPEKGCYVRVNTSRIMFAAIIEVMRMIESFNLHRIDFRCVSGNPAEKKYVKIIRRICRQGKYDVETPMFRDNIRDYRGHYHDTIVYELIRREE